MEIQSLQSFNIARRQSVNNPGGGGTQVNFGNCAIKIFIGGRGSDLFCIPSPYEQFCLCPSPIARCFWKYSLMTPRHLTSNIFKCYNPRPSPHSPPLLRHRNFDRMHRDPHPRRFFSAPKNVMPIISNPKNDIADLSNPKNSKSLLAIYQRSRIAFCKPPKITQIFNVRQK